MFGSILPREGKFFDLFKGLGDLTVQAAVEFRAMLEDLSHAEKHARAVKDIEHQADELTHQTVELLHKTFITPLDREDIHQLVSRLDDVVDFIDAAATRIQMYEIRESTPEFKELADTIVKAAEAIQRCMNHIHDISKHPDLVKKASVEINQHENEADHILRSAVAKLFKEEKDIRQLIKLKEIYELLETVTDRCEDVANIVEGILLEYA